MKNRFLPAPACADRLGMTKVVRNTTRRRVRRARLIRPEVQVRFSATTRLLCAASIVPTAWRLKMKILAQFAVLFLLVVSVLKVQPPLAPAQGIRPAPQDRAAIERLYRQDVEATLSGRADDLAKLWDNDAVRIQPGSAPQIGKAAIYATDKREELSGAGQSVCYKPEIKELQLAGDWAFEWGYFSY